MQGEDVVDYDIDSYAQQLDQVRGRRRRWRARLRHSLSHSPAPLRSARFQLLSARITQCSALRAKLQRFQRLLSAEEEQSRRVATKHGRRPAASALAAQ